MAESYPFWKGHGTENDFVLVPAEVELTPERIRALCDRRAGIGGDGVIRAVRESTDPDGRWFMDYWNSDGSTSEMCGNGIRLFGRHLALEGLADPSGPVPVGTRDGVKTLTFAGGAADGELTVDMGTPKVLEETEVSVAVSGVERRWPATHIDMGNPHAVAWVDDLADVGPLTDAPAHDETLVIEAQRSSRLPLVLATIGAVLVLGAALAAPLMDRVVRGDEAAQRALDLTLVETWDITDRAHTTDEVDYAQDPPAGGAHAPVWLACGVYDEPVRDENAVHDLEHGTVWITYDPEAGVDVGLLAGLLPQNGILSPYDGLGSPVVVTVWGRQLALDGAADARLPLFLDTYAGGETAPEPFASCAGGVPSPSGRPGATV